MDHYSERGHPEKYSEQREQDRGRGRENQYDMNREDRPEWLRQRQGYQGRYSEQSDYERQGDYRRGRGDTPFPQYDDDYRGQGDYGRESDTTGSWRTGYGNSGRHSDSTGSWRTGYGDYGRQGDYSSGSWLTGYEQDDTHRGRNHWNEGPEKGRGPSGYQRSDERIREDANEHLTEHGWLDARNIQVDVHEGIITLKGTVSNRRAKRLAEDTVETISGVKDVQNQLQVKTENSGNGWQQNPQEQNGELQEPQQGQAKKYQK